MKKTLLEWQIAYAWVPQGAKECPSDAIKIVRVKAATKEEALAKTRMKANADGSQVATVEWIKQGMPLCDLEMRILTVIGDKKALAKLMKGAYP